MKSRYFRWADRWAVRLADRMNAYVCAVIAPDLPEVLYPIPDDQTGLRLRPADTGQLASVLRALMNDAGRIRNPASQV